MRQVRAVILQKRKLNSVRIRAGIQIQALWPQSLNNTSPPHLLEAQGINSEVTDLKRLGTGSKEGVPLARQTTTESKSPREATPSLCWFSTCVFWFGFGFPAYQESPPLPDSNINEWKGRVGTEDNSQDVPYPGHSSNWLLCEKVGPAQPDLLLVCREDEHSVLCQPPDF